MAILYFSDALTEARRRAQLTGRPLSQSESAGIAQGYSATAAERAAEQKRLALAEESQALAEKSQAAQERQFSESLQANQEQWAKNYGLQMAQLESQQGQFAANLELAYANANRAGEEFNKTYQLQYEQYQAQRQAAERAMAQQQTNTYVTAGVSLASMVILGLLLL